MLFLSHILPCLELSRITTDLIYCLHMWTVWGFMQCLLHIHRTPSILKSVNPVCPYMDCLRIMQCQLHTHRISQHFKKYKFCQLLMVLFFVVFYEIKEQLRTNKWTWSFYACICNTYRLLPRWPLQSWLWKINLSEEYLTHSITVNLLNMVSGDTKVCQTLKFAQ